MDTFALIAQERLALADQLSGLTSEQWAAPSLCDAWSIREVVGHLVATHTVSMPRFLWQFALARGSFDRANSTLAVREGARPVADLVDDLRRVATSQMTPPGFGPEAPMTDVLIHGLDIRIPLGLTDDRPIEPWRIALDLLVSPKARRAFVHGRLPAVTLRASDLDWSSGAGDDVRGSARALTMALTGRHALREDLDGPGTEALIAFSG